MHDESKLPKWAQEEITKLRIRNQLLENIAITDDVLKGRDFLVIIFDDLNPDEYRTLYLLDKDRPHALMSVKKGDMLIRGTLTERF